MLSRSFIVHCVLYIGVIHLSSSKVGTLWIGKLKILNLHFYKIIEIIRTGGNIQML